MIDTLNKFFNTPLLIINLSAIETLIFNGEIEFKRVYTSICFA